MVPLLLPILVPLALGAVAWLLSRRMVEAVRWMTLLATLAVLVLCAWLWGKGAAPLEWTFVTVESVTLRLALSMTNLGGLLAMAAAGLSMLVVLFSIGWSGKLFNTGKFHAYVLWSLSAAMVAFYANDFVTLLFAWEALSALLYLLISQGSEESAPGGAAKTFGLLGLSDCCLVLGVALALSLGGTTIMNGFHITAHTPATYAAYLLFALAALAKAGAFPLHSWIPAASEGAPAPVMALLPAALDKLLGIYLLVRVSFEFFALDGALSTVLLVVGAVTLLSAVFMAMMQHDLPRLLSFHAVSQVGYMVIGLGTGTPVGVVGGLFHMLNHAIYKSCLFLCASRIEERTGERDLDRIGGLARKLPATFLGCAIAGLAISGVPPLNGFVSKWLIYQGLLETASPLGPFVLVVAVFGSALTLASFVKVVHSCFWAAAPDTQVLRPERRGWATITPILVLSLLCVGLGLWATAPVGYFASVAEADFGQGGAPALTGAALAFAGGLWSPVTATTLVLLGILGGLALYAVSRIKIRSVASFTAGEQLPARDVPFRGTAFYRTIRELPGLSTLYSDGEAGAYDVYRLGGRYGGTLVNTLRRLHTGVLLVYVSWAVIGLALILGFLLKG